MIRPELANQILTILGAMYDLKLSEHEKTEAYKQVLLALDCTLIDHSWGEFTVHCKPCLEVYRFHLDTGNYFRQVD